jgi:2-hydroxy-3-keto-5-methylthiopentenyl-1-phosphate phosphatase
MTSKKIFTRDIIAFVYDFDGTLSPQPMQEYTVLPKLGVSGSQFWREVDEEARKTTSDRMLTYMRMMLEKAETKREHLGRKDFKKLGRSIKYFKGVSGWFSRMNGYVRDISGGRVRIRHYLISAGIKEILEGVGIRKHFRRIYASEYHFDHHDVAKFPKLLINDTTKTQFLFRINKGLEKLSQNINEHMDESLRPVPFSNIIYIGDGDSDVPGMAVTKKSGGNAIAVYAPGKRGALQACKILLRAGRVDFVARADFREGQELDRRVKLLLDAVIANIEYQREVFHCKREHRIPT